MRVADDIPRHQKKTPKHKRFGIEQQGAFFPLWCCRQWYATAKARDQAFENLTTKSCILRGTKWDRPVRKVDR